MGQSIPAIVAGNTFADIPINGFTAQVVAVTNPGSSWVHFTQTAGAYAWIPPRWYGVIMPCPTPYGSLRVDLTSTPSSAYPQDTSDLTAAQVTIHEDALPFSAGQSLLSLLPPSGNIPQSNLTQLAGVSLTGWPMPWGTRWQVNTSTNRLVGTHTFDIPQFVAAVNSNFALFDGLTLPRTNTGLAAPSGRAVLYCANAAGVAGGTATFSLLDAEMANTGATANLGSSTALAIGSSAALQFAPGLTPAANLVFNAVVGNTPRVQIVIATQNCQPNFTLDLF